MVSRCQKLILTSNAVFNGSCSSQGCRVGKGLQRLHFIGQWTQDTKLVHHLIHFIMYFILYESKREKIRIYEKLRVKRRPQLQNRATLIVLGYDVKIIVINMRYWFKVVKCLPYWPHDRDMKFCSSNPGRYFLFKVIFTEIRFPITCGNYYAKENLVQLVFSTDSEHEGGFETCTKLWVVISDELRNRENCVRWGSNWKKCLRLERLDFTRCLAT